MQYVTFQLKVITPTLMGGGFGQNDGIRPSEIKGMMRYWFRAIAGSVIGNDIKAIKSLEEKAFGSQERKSPFRILITDKNLSFFDENSKDLHFNQMNGLVYLGIGNVIFEHLGKRKKRELGIDKEEGFWFNSEKINIIAPNSTFKIRFLFNPSLNLEIKKLITLSFYLATAFGGFGLRARRGFGSWQIEDVKVEGLNKDDFDNLNDYSLENINKKIDNAQEILRILCETLGIKIQDSLKDNIKLDFTNFINYELKQIQTDKTDWKDLLKDLGAYYRYFRVNPISNDLKKDNFKRKHSLDYDEILDKTKREKELYNPIFGLKIIYKKDISVNLKSNDGTLRRASPLFISVKEINDNLAINLFISISTNFKDSQQRVKVDFKKREFPVKVKNLHNYKTITDFIEKLEKAMGKQNGN